MSRRVRNSDSESSDEDDSLNFKRKKAKVERIRTISPPATRLSQYDCKPNGSLRRAFEEAGRTTPKNGGLRLALEEERRTPTKRLADLLDDDENVVPLLREEVKKEEIEWPEVDPDFVMERLEFKESSLNEEVAWFHLKEKDRPPGWDLQTLLEGRKVGEKITNVVIDPENAFIDPKVYEDLISWKKVFETDALDSISYQMIRSRANIFERIDKGPFLCRAAMKMANLDEIMKGELTNPKTPQGLSALGPMSLFYFADVCAGPGGFSEYVLWKKKWDAKGFGFTLKGPLDFDAPNFVVEAETFEAFYGEAGDGNVYNPVNVSGYIRHVMTTTGNKGVHLMMADGGFEVTKQEHLQEVLSHQIILSQIYIALCIVRPGGHFVCKLFDTVTPFTVALIYFASLAFDFIAIHKPITSRPANSERYLICKWRKPFAAVTGIIQYLADCHNLMWEFINDNNNKNQAILELLPIKAITDPAQPFIHYIRKRSKCIATGQIETLKLMVAFAKDFCLSNVQNQQRARKKALALWQIPEKIPIPAYGKTCDTACALMLEELPLTMLRHPEKDLSPMNIEKLFKSAYDWRFIPVSGFRGAPNRGFYLSLGRGLVYRYDGSLWVPMPQHEPHLELPSKTLVYAEFAHEIYGSSPSNQMVIDAFHIIDALILGGVDLRTMHYTQRQENIAKFTRALARNGVIPVRAKVPIRMENLINFLEKLENRVVKGAGVGSRLVCPLNIEDPYHSPYVVPQGLLFLRITKEPWQMALNRQTRKKYFFNTADGMTSDSIPEAAISGFFNTMGNRVLWPWDFETNVILTRVEENDGRIATLNPHKLHACHLVSYINYTIAQPPTVSPPRTLLPLQQTEQITQIKQENAVAIKAERAS